MLFYQIAMQNNDGRGIKEVSSPMRTLKTLIIPGDEAVHHFHLAQEQIQYPALFICNAQHEKAQAWIGVVENLKELTDAVKQIISKNSVVDFYVFCEKVKVGLQSDIVKTMAFIYVNQLSKSGIEVFCNAAIRELNVPISDMEKSMAYAWADEGQALLRVVGIDLFGKQENKPEIFCDNKNDNVKSKGSPATNEPCVKGKDCSENSLLEPFSSIATEVCPEMPKEEPKEEKEPVRKFPQFSPNNKKFGTPLAYSFGDSAKQIIFVSYLETLYRYSEHLLQIVGIEQFKKSVLECPGMPFYEDPERGYAFDVPEKGEIYLDLDTIPEKMQPKLIHQLQELFPTHTVSFHF